MPRRPSPERSPFQPGNIPSVLRKAQWIWAENHQWDLYNCYALFRKSFVLDSVPPRCELAITADHSYQLYVNGSYVCRGPARGFQDHWPFDTVEIARWLKNGTNVIAVRAFHPGASTFQYISRGFAGLLVGARIGRMEIVTDRSWRCRRQVGVSRDPVPSSLQLYPQEHFDARREDLDWMSPDYDDSGWRSEVYFRPYNAMPWPQLEPRGIPLLDESLYGTGSLIGKQAGLDRTEAGNVRDVVALRAAEGLDFVPAGGADSPLSVAPSRPGGFTSFLLDFGRTIVGTLELDIDGAVGGEILDTLTSETVSAAPLRPDVAINTHCRLAFGNRLVCRPGRTTHRFYHPAGFRYLVLTIRGNRQRLRVAHRVYHVRYPLEEKGRFSSSNPAFERIWQTCAWTQRCCSMDAYVDTPWREQAQWWGDARVQGWNTFHLDGDSRLFRRGIHCIASQTTPDGVTYGHSPTIAHECVLPDFSLIWLLTLWDYYWQTGSTEAFRSHLSTVAGLLGYFESQTDARHGLLRYDPRYWLFLDWTDIFKEGYPTLYSLWYLVALDRLAALARLTGEKSLLLRVTKAGRRLRRALVPLRRADGLMSDGLSWNGRRVSGASVQTQTLAMMNGLFRPDWETMLNKRLLPVVRGKTLRSMPTPYWLTFVYGVLIDHGFETDVLASIGKLWPPMAEHGTTWEVYNPVRGQESFSHAWSAHPLYHFAQTIGGIRQTGPAWAEIDFRPIFQGEHGGARIPAPPGMIESAWRRLPEGIQVTLHLPLHVRATVILPGQKPFKVHGVNIWMLPA